MIRFILADLNTRRVGALLLVLIIALATALGVVVTVQERALRLGSARAASAFDLVVGAPGSETQLVLSSVFLQPAALPLLPGSVLADLSRDPRVTFAAPIGFGDFFGSSPIVGTTSALVHALGGLSDGAGLAHLDEAIVGARVALAPGDTLHPMHGHVEEGGHEHAHVAYRVVGRLVETGTPWDRAILVPIQAVWHIHGHHAGHEEPETGNEHADEHTDGDPDEALAGPVDENAVRQPDAPGVPAILIKPASIAAAYALRQDYRTSHTLAVFPGEVLTRLYGTLGDARRVLATVAAGAQALVGAAILLVVMAEVVQRRRQIGALRAFGAPRAVLFTLVWLESFVLLGLGVLTGLGVGLGASVVLSSVLAGETGVSLPVTLTGTDAAQGALLLGLGALAALVPAFSAYRQSPAEALRD
ncbi:FtsX-like permease family protein [Pararhodospirillum oryzae]|uniref:Membrane protein n=1 Tax=Pararhodospirillum oryzae TaxID=478448 RepID=A0A512H7B5_9PROT|nr:FtsX-like permease family protein [Pararhodospirillum oryzae]GEO81353.1 membrane protein [Pararhodospirillum oryzae]